MKLAVLTTRQINSVSTSLELYHFVVLCEVQQMSGFHSVLQNHFDAVEVAFLYNSNEEGKATMAGVCTEIFVVLHVRTSNCAHYIC